MIKSNYSMNCCQKSRGEWKCNAGKIFCVQNEIRELETHTIGLTAGIVATPEFGSARMSCGKFKGIFFTSASTRAMLDLSEVYLFLMSRFNDVSRARRIALPTLLF